MDLAQGSGAEGVGLYAAVVAAGFEFGDFSQGVQVGFGAEVHVGLDEELAAGLEQADEVSRPGRR